MNNIERFIETSEDLAVELETGLSKRPAIAPEADGEGELDKCEYLETWLRAHGISLLERHDAPDDRAKGGVRPNLVATIPGKSDTGRLWIMSHLDVVPPGEAGLWESDPWTVVRRDDGPLGPRLIARGTEDNQQGLVSSVIAALALVNSGITPPKTVKLLFAADEEVGSVYGVIWLIKNRDLFRKTDMILIPDGGDPRGETIEIAEKNLLWARFVTKGQQTHGSRPDQGANAHLAGADLVVRLHRELSKTFADRDPLFEPDYSTFQPTKKEANVPNFNTIPGEDVFCMDMRILPRYPIKTVLAEIDRIKAGVESEYGVTVTYSLSQRLESRPTPADAPIINLLSEAVMAVYGIKTRTTGVGYGTVGAPIRNMDIPAVVWSRMEDMAHRPNEFATIANILGNARVMARLMMPSH
jgi:succinyl-diaminopimelate desuccinylase